MNRLVKILFSPFVILLFFCELIVRILTPVALLFTLGSDPQAPLWQRPILGPYEMFKWFGEMIYSVIKNEGVREFITDVLQDLWNIFLTNTPVNIYNHGWWMLLVVFGAYFIMKVLLGILSAMRRALLR